MTSITLQVVMNSLKNPARLPNYMRAYSPYHTAAQKLRVSETDLRSAIVNKCPKINDLLASGWEGVRAIEKDFFDKMDVVIEF